MSKGKADARRRADPPRRYMWSAIGLALAAAIAAGWAFGLFGAGSSAAQEVVVYKSPYCGCCASWAKRLTRAGFTITVRNVEDLDPVKRRYKVPGRLEACHTAVVDGYVVEGHVPVASIRRMLRERPEIAGIAVPGMPAGAPGMDAGGRRDPYDVLTFTADGAVATYESYR